MRNKKAVDYANEFIDPILPNEELFEQKYKEYLEMENQKDKEAFFAQYFGQSVAGIHREVLSSVAIMNIFHGSHRYLDNFLLLKSLETISDEDVREIGIIKTSDSGICYSNEFYIEMGESVIKQLFLTNIEIFDYLRSRGYILSFRNYSVEEILKMGWARYQ